MQAQLVPPARVSLPDGRSLAAAGLCVAALFSEGLGWVLAIGGIVLLRRAAFTRQVKWLLAAVAITPKILFIGVRSLNAPGGISFPIESWNLATSPALWAWSILLAAFGAYLVFLPQGSPAAPTPLQPREGRSFLIAGLGLVMIGGAAVMLLGLTDGFHRIDDAGQGRWALRHAARGNVAVFSGSELRAIDAVEQHVGRSNWSYAIRVVLTNGRSFSVTTKSSGALDELRKFATTANVPGKVRILRRRDGQWTSGTSGFGLKDCVGTYDLADEQSGSHSTVEFWLEGERLTGKETVADGVGRHVRVLRNIKLSDSGEVEFQPATYIEASQKQKGDAVHFSFSWSPQGQTGRFVRDGFETGLQKYRKR